METKHFVHRGRRQEVHHRFKEPVCNQDLASDSKAKREDHEGVEPNERGVLRLGECSEDETSSLNGLFHWQVRNYEVFQPECNILQIQEAEFEERYPEVYKEYKEGTATLRKTLAHIFEKEVEYKEAKLQTVNLGEKDQPKEILIGDNWDPVLKATSFTIFLEYKDIFAWTYRNLKGVPPELCVHQIPLVPGARPMRKRPY